MTTNEVETYEEAADEGDGVLDEEWVTTAQRRSRWRLVLVASLVMALAFLGGVLVQKNFGPAQSADSSAGGQAGLPAGFPGGAGVGGAAPGGAAGGGSVDEAGASTSSAVIGTVVSIEGTTWTVQDLGGTKHTVTVPAEASIVREKKISASKVAVGSTVDISGTTEQSGDLAASTVTVR